LLGSLRRMASFSSGEGNQGMFFRPHPASRGRRLLATFALLLVAGCSGTQSADQALDKSLAAARRERTKVYPLAGKLMVDGAPPELDLRERIILMLNDPAKLDTSPNLRPHVFVNATGEFSFQTYVANDGVQPGTYIVTFAKLTKKPKGLLGPDGFHNLYNDAERNQQQYPELKIEHQAPGKKDCYFDLRIAGRDEVAPGPRALTQLKR
jgi:hypothetical protein